MPTPQLLGCDFTSSPGRRKPIVLAWGRLAGDTVHPERFEHCDSLAAFGARLATPAHWVGAFDLPFGLPRELVTSLGWPLDWAACMDRYVSLSRPQLRALFRAFCAARPAGAKFAHRAADGPAGASPSMKWVNPPVAWMMHAGVPLLRAAGVHLPGLAAGDPTRVALEAYPGLLAREALQGRRSYKSDDPRKQTPERRRARIALLDALCHGQGLHRLALRLQLSPAHRGAVVEDASGDTLDALLCLLQAAWALRAHGDGALLYGLPPELDPLEGWILTAPWPPVSAPSPPSG